MKARFIHSFPAWNYSLLIFVVFFVFVVPVFPGRWQHGLYNIVLTLIFIVSALNIERSKKTILAASMVSMVLLWLSTIFNMPVINTLSKIAGIIFFCTVVINFIMMISRSRQVNQKVILESINGYLLLSIMYALIVGFIAYYHPAAFTFMDSAAGSNQDSFSNYLYFVLVTISTLGYGDVVPVMPYARSLSTLISITGQLYIAIIIAMLVGKFASQQSKNYH